MTRELGGHGQLWVGDREHKIDCDNCMARVQIAWLTDEVDPQAIVLCVDCLQDAHEQLKHALEIQEHVKK